METLVFKEQQTLRRILFFGTNTSETSVCSRELNAINLNRLKHIGLKTDSTVNHNLSFLLLAVVNSQSHSP